MNIGMLLNAPYPSDVRIKKEADTLLRGGHSVFLLCLRKQNESYQEDYEGIRIQRIDAGKNNIILAFWDIVMSASFVHPAFARIIPAWIKSNSIEALHVHDLPLVGTALAAKKKSPSPLFVVSDFHENYPDALKIWFEWKKNPLARLKNKLFLNPKRWSQHEQTAVQQSDKVIAVVEEMKQRIILQYNVNPDKVVLVSNTEDVSFLDQPLDKNVYGDLLKDKFIITYTGNIGPHRGVDTAIEAMRYLLEFPNLILVIVGSGGVAVMNNLKAQITSNKLQEKVFLLGRQPFNKFYSYMHFASANIIPHKSNSHTDNTIPHKLFQGMLAGKPMIVSSSTPLRRIVTKANSGVVFEAGDPQDLAEKIKYLYLNEEIAKRCAENGLAATVTGEMNWRIDGANLVAMYNSLTK